MFKPSESQIADARGAKLPDVIAPGLNVLFCGINPSLYSAAVGHHFARPGNRFWPALFAAGFTDRQFSPFEDRLLLDDGCGLTNLVDRATARADELTTQELRKAVRRLRSKVDRHQPRLVAFLGVGAYRTAFGRSGAAVGLQDHHISSADVWLLPNTSGLNAHYQLSDFSRLFAELRDASLSETRTT